jgi:pyruvate ferredoxin oxidoreductase delta subunit
MSKIKKAFSEKNKDNFTKAKKKKGQEFGAVIKNDPQNYPQTGNWGYSKPEISSKCIGCGRCAEFCPENAIEIKGKNKGRGKAEVDLKYCKGCGLCAEVCPVKAIEMKSKNKGN